MKRIIRSMSVIISIAVLLALIYMGFDKGIGENLSLYIVIAAVTILVSSYFYFEKSSMGTKEIALIATLSSFAAAVRVPFAALPNIQPSTFIVALSGYVFGPYEGFLIGATTAFVSNIFLGQGPWTPWQMLAWGIIGSISGILGRISVLNSKKITAEKFAFLCFFYGFLFDWIMNLWHVVGYIKPLRLEAIMLAYASGLIFDIMHSIGNFIFALFFYENLYKVLHRFKKRLEITYL
jgi:energy-coupling factor transport system substrate-specific component